MIFKDLGADYKSQIKVRTHTQKRPFNSSVAIKIRLLGPKHDRDIVIAYEGVNSYKIYGQNNKFNYNDTHHGDINTHEIEFVSDSRMIINCVDFKVDEILLTEPASSNDAEKLRM